MWAIKYLTASNSKWHTFCSNLATHIRPESFFRSSVCLIIWVCCCLSKSESLYTLNSARLAHLDGLIRKNLKNLDKLSVVICEVSQESQYLKALIFGFLLCGSLCQLHKIPATKQTKYYTTGPFHFLGGPVHCITSPLEHNFTKNIPQKQVSVPCWVV